MSDETVKVVVRCRPPNEKEAREGRGVCVCVRATDGVVAITNPLGSSGTTGASGAAAAGTAAGGADADTKTFTFDAVYDASSTQRAVYEETAFALVESVLQGFNGTIFAYGQTGSGKTWSMQGRSEPPELRGITPNSFDHIFEYIKQAADKEFLVRCSFLELYNEEIRDLLGKDDRKLDLRENPDGVYVQDLTYVVVDSAATLEKVLNDGNRRRTVGATAMNAESSRSHSIFTVIVEASENRDGRDCITRGKLNLVDLAGSERINKTGATGTRMKEGIKINLSLTALGNVIQALVDGKSKHIPYRDSKLTRLLSDSLGGNTRTVMLAAINDADYNYEETLSTLRYANRAKNIKNKPVINEDPKDALLRQYKEEIEQLKALLAQHLSGAGLAPAAVSAILGQAGAGSSSAQVSAMTALMTAGPPAAALPVAPGPSTGAPASAPAPAPAAAGPEAPTPTSSAATAPTPAGSPTAPSSAADAAVPAPTIPADADAADSADTAAAPQPPTPAQPNDAPLAAVTAPTDTAALEAAKLEAERERREREELANKLLALQHMLLASGVKTSGKKKGPRRTSALESRGPAEATGEDDTVSGAAAVADAELDPEVILARQQHEHRRAQMKLRMQKKKEAKLREEQAALAEEKAAVEEDMRLLSENVASLASDLSTKERIIKKLRAKYIAKVDAVKKEMADAADEWSTTRETLMTTVREQAREMKLLEQVALTFLTQRELGRIWERAEYDEEAERWNLPQIRPKQGWRARMNTTSDSSFVGFDDAEDDGGVIIDDSAMPSLAAPAYRGSSADLRFASGSAGVPTAGLPTIGGGGSRGASRSPSRSGERTVDSGALPVLTSSSARQSSARQPNTAAESSFAGPLPVVASGNRNGRSSAAPYAPVAPDAGALPALPGIASGGVRTRVAAERPPAQNARDSGLPAIGGTPSPFAIVSDGLDVSAAWPPQITTEETEGILLPQLGGPSAAPAMAPLSSPDRAVSSTPVLLPGVGGALQPVAPPRDRAPSRSGTRRPRPAAKPANTTSTTPKMNAPSFTPADDEYPPDFADAGPSPRRDDAGAASMPALPSVRNATNLPASSSNAAAKTSAPSGPTSLPSVGSKGKMVSSGSSSKPSVTSSSSGGGGALPSIGGGKSGGASAVKGKPATGNASKLSGGLPAL